MSIHYIYDMMIINFNIIWNYTFAYQDISTENNKQGNAGISRVRKTQDRWRELRDYQVVCVGSGKT